MVDRDRLAATIAGITIGVDDMRVPEDKPQLLADAESRVDAIEREFRRGLITEEERYNQTVEVWRRTTDDVTQRMLEGLDKTGSVWMITHSSARGNVTQVHQLAGMRGLMADPSGRIIELPIRSNLREGMSAPEQLVQLLLGLAPKAAHRSYFPPSALDLGAGRAPSLGPACFLCAALVATEVANLVLQRRPPRVAPHFVQFDPLVQAHVTGRLRWGNRHPLQRLRRWWLLRRHPRLRATLEPAR